MNVLKTHFANQCWLWERPSGRDRESSRAEARSHKSMCEMVFDQRSPGVLTRNLDGFMLLEVILAVGLLAISLFAIIDSLGRCIAAAKAVQNYSVSEILLANKGFEFRTERAADIFDQEGTFDDYPGYSWSRRLERTDTEGLWEQTITVYWHERGKVVSDAVVQYRYLPEKQQ